MNIPDTTTLRKAIALTTKIERLQEQLHTLLAENLLAKPKESLPKSVRSTRKKSQALQQAIEKNSQKEIFTSETKVSLPLELEDKNPELLLMADDGQEQLALVTEKDSF